jgi:SAM-dependent methyltransferase
VAALVSTAEIIWHDLECGAYRADLPFWRKLAATSPPGAVLEIGAGTGRVTLDLARGGREVLALERDGDLAAELRRRGAGLPIEVICADACDFAIDRRVPLCIVAMQTVQLLADRPAFMRCALAALEPGGLLALAVLGRDVQPFEIELPADVAEHDGLRYTSAPTALRERGDSVLLERRRTILDGDSETASLDVARLARLEPATLAAEALAVGFAYRGLLTIAATDQHAGSQVVMLEAVRG